MLILEKAPGGKEGDYEGKRVLPVTWIDTCSGDRGNDVRGVRVGSE